MSEIWYKKLGFYANPFSIKPGAYDTDLIAYDLSMIFKKIKKGEMIFIEGEFGTGKTTILKNIISEFRGKNRIIYYSFNSGENSFDLNSLLDGATPVIKKIIGLWEKNIILLLDEVHLMKQNEAKKLLKPYQEGILKSVVFVSHDFDEVDFPLEFKKYLNGNLIKTVDLSNKEAITLVRKRIGNLQIIDDKTISKIFLLADKNPRRLLEYCEDIIRYTLDIGDDKVKDYHVEEVLKDVIKDKKRKEKLKQVEPIQIKTLEKEEQIKEQQKKEQVIKVQETKEEFPKNVEEEKIKDKKFKINKLVTEPSKNSLGTISEKEETDENKETSEYKVYYVNE